jgi:hypothetical protein
MLIEADSINLKKLARREREEPVPCTKVDVTFIWPCPPDSDRAGWIQTSYSEWWFRILNADYEFSSCSSSDYLKLLIFFFYLCGMYFGNLLSLYGRLPQ